MICICQESVSVWFSSAYTAPLCPVQSLLHRREGTPMIAPHGSPLLWRLWFVVDGYINCPCLLCAVCLWSVLWKHSAWWLSNNVITTDCFSIEPSACIDCVPHTQSDSMYSINGLSLSFIGYRGDWQSSLFFFLGDAFPAGSSPFLSGYPGHSHLTSDPAYRSANPSGLQMAQLWASHAHEGKSPIASTDICISLSLFLSHYIIQMLEDTSDIIFSWQSAPVQSPGGLFLCLSLLTPVGSCSISVSLLVAPGSVLYVSRFLCPPPVS